MTAFNASLRLTPSNSPFFKSPTPRSPTKSSRAEEPGLHLKKVIGTTTASANAFDTLPDARKFAFTAGAAAVIATVHDDLSVTQHFFRALPTFTSSGREGSWPLSPTPNESRQRVLGNIKEQASAGSPLNSSSRDWADSPGRSTTAKDKVKAATSVALSPNGKWLAVGETGYKPRVLIFSAKDGSSETPVAVMAEHTFGVHALRFSPDSRYLASLGAVNDGFLYVWSIDERSGAAILAASNKCTTTVNSMIWMGRAILTAGLRFVKLWRPDEDSASEGRVAETNSRASILVTPRPKIESRASDFGNSILTPKHRTLAGKNCLLGDMLDATFTCAVAISHNKAILCTDAGDICLLDDSERMQALSLAANAGMRVSAARIDDRDMLHVAGVDGSASSYLLPDLERRAGTPGRSRRPSGTSVRAPAAKGVSIVAIASIGDAIVEIDSNRVIRLTREDEGSSVANHVSARQLTAHEDAVLGIRPIASSTFSRASFLTFSGNGTVLFWDRDGISVADGLSVPIQNSSQMYGMPNELKVVTSLADGTLIACGDKYGTVSLMDLGRRILMHQLRAHSAEVLDLVSFTFESAEYLVSASRDRTVQLFMLDSGQLELLQTMDEHAAAVNGLLMSRNNDHLFSCSADRSIVVRENILRNIDDPSTLAFGMLRAITLKSAPTSMCLTAQPDTLLVSTIDRCIGKYSTKHTKPGFSFKCSDNEGGEAAVMSKILFIASLEGNPTIAGVSSSDKSVRLYTEYGSLVARDIGHCEPITDIAFIPGASEFGPSHIVTVAADSTIFLWDSRVSPIRAERSSENANENEESPSSSSTVLGPPLRKVISHSEMSRFRRTKSADDQDAVSPGAIMPPSSPHRLHKRSSRASLAQAPRLEPGPRTTFGSSRRTSLLPNRSPSPPSPRAGQKKAAARRPSLGMSLRSKSSDSLLSTTANGSTGFGSLTSSTESVTRTLRAFRKKLANAPNNESHFIAPDTLQELEKELRLTARVVGENNGKLNEASMTKLLDQASDRLVDLLDERLKIREAEGA